jgi:hypothetical protein
MDEDEDDFSDLPRDADGKVQICGAELFTKSGKATGRRCVFPAHHPHARQVHSCLPERLAIKKKDP